MSTQLDPGQVLKKAFDETTNSLQVNVVAASSSNSTSINDGVDNTLKATVSAAGALKVDATIVSGDIEIGAVELKNAGDDTRAVIKTDGVNNALVVTQNSQPLPSGAATSAKQDTSNTSLASIDGKITAVNTGAVTIVNASGASAVNVQDGGNSLTVDGTVAATQSGTWNITNVSGTVALPTGAATESTLSTLNGKIPSSLTVTSTRLLVDGSGVTQPISSTLDSSSSSSVTSVASSATSVSLLASTAGRKGAYFFNDSTSILYLKFGATASTSSYTVQIQPGGFFEMPTKPVYTGAMDGIWSSADGNVRITELS